MKHSILRFGLTCLSTGFFALSSIQCGLKSLKTPYEKLDFKNSSFHVFRVDPHQDSVIIGWRDNSGNVFRSFRSFESSVNLELNMITNAGMYSPNNNPVGLYVKNSQIMVQLDTQAEGYGNFYLQPNGVFGMIKDSFFVCTTRSLFESEVLSKVGMATQSGPMLVINDNVHSAFRKGSSNLNIRSGVGVDKNGNAVFAISENPVNFYDFATLFRDSLHCSNALYLDGAISKMKVKYGETHIHADGDFGPMIGVSIGAKK